MTSALQVYRTAPNMERKAADELRQAGIGAIVPLDATGKRQRVTAPGYVFADHAYHSAFAKHVRSSIGRVHLAEVMRMFVNPPPEADARTYAPGDKVVVLIGAFAEMPGTISEHRRNGYMVHVPLLGKTCSVFVPEQYLKRHIDPG